MRETNPTVSSTGATMQAIKITVAVSILVLNVFIWHTEYTIAAENTTLQPQEGKEYTKTQKSLIELGFQPSREAQPSTVVVQPQNKRGSTHREQVNTRVVGIMSGDVNGIDVRMAVDMASVLDGVENLRLLPIIGKESVQNIIDLLYLKGVDISIMQSDVLSYLKGQSAYRGLNQRIRYITTLYNKEMHLLVGKETGNDTGPDGEKSEFRHRRERDEHDGIHRLWQCRHRGCPHVF